MKFDNGDWWIKCANKANKGTTIAHTLTMMFVCISEKRREEKRKEKKRKRCDIRYAAKSGTGHFGTFTPDFIILLKFIITSEPLPLLFYFIFLVQLFFPFTAFS